MRQRFSTPLRVTALLAAGITGCGMSDDSHVVAPAAAVRPVESPADTSRRAEGSLAKPVCDLIAAPGADAGSSGSFRDPLGSVAALDRRLEPRQTGCLRGGTFEAELTKITTPRVRLRSFPGERATISGRLWVDARAVKILGLLLDSSTVAVTSTSPTVTAPDVVFRGNDVTNHHEGGICFGLGSNEGFGFAVRTVIERNRIHDCGQLPTTNYHHGIYATFARDVVIRHNLIYGNADRGVQLFPDADRTRVVGNVIAGNGEGVIISGNQSSTSDGNLIEGNLITDSVERWNVESNWVGDLVGSDNVVQRNCLFSASEMYGAGGGIQPPRLGFRARRNLVAEPLYADPERGSFMIPADSACRAVTSAGSPAERELRAMP